MIHSIAVIGSGTMGGGIAEIAALAEIPVVVYDVSAEALTRGSKRVATDLSLSVEKGRLTPEAASAAEPRIRWSTELAAVKETDLVIEAAVEDLAKKQELFRRLDALLAPHALLATNTSSLSITAIASATRRPASVIGMHFFNPPTVMKLVEVVCGKETSEDTARVISDVARRLGKVPVLCQDTPGFIVNRVARPFYGEALRILGEGVASVEEIDRIVKLSGRFRMGPFELMDLIGIDINYAVTKSVYEQFFHEPRFRPHPLQRQMVEAGTLGRKSGRGFYPYKQ
jgi:3-hydroxybutyryl-CoA dehydrogenase